MEGKTEMTTSYVVTHVICHIRTLLSDAHSIGLVRDEHRFSHLALGPALILGTLQLNHVKLEVLLVVEHLETNVCLLSGVGYEPGRFFCRSMVSSVYSQIYCSPNKAQWLDFQVPGRFLVYFHLPSTPKDKGP